VSGMEHTHPANKNGRLHSEDFLIDGPPCEEEKALCIAVVQECRTSELATPW
jgi:hypothetical protein